MSARVRDQFDAPPYRRDPFLTWWERAGEDVHDRIMPVLEGIGVWIVFPLVSWYFIILGARVLYGATHHH